MPAVATKNGNQQAVVEARPFVAGSREIDEAKYDDSLTVTTSTQRFDSFSITPTGFLGGIWLLVEGVAGSNTATVVFDDDAPWSALDTVYLTDVGNQPLVGPISGYDLYVINKYGGYHQEDDPHASSVYSVTAGSGATGGSFTFILYIPLEIVHRDALGVLPNQAANATFRLDVTLGTSANIYDTAPTVAATVRLRTILEGWQFPQPIDINNMPVSQNPPAAQTTQYWQKSTLDISSGAFDRKLDNFNGLLRNLIFINRDTSGGVETGRVTGDASWPDPFTFAYGKNLLVDSRIRAVWRHWIATHYGYNGAVETSGAGSATTFVDGRDLGVYPLTWARNFGLKVGGELRLTYLPVSDATSLVIKGSMGSACNTVALFNYVRYVGDPRALTMGK